MGIYEFECLKCNKKYDDIAPYDESEVYPSVECPNCKSKEKIKLVSSCSFQFSNPVGTDKWNSSSKGHDYRFKHNIPKVQAERKMAEALSHMGTDPYKSNIEKDLNLDVGIHDPETRSGLS
jgi:putative FmdB family regulatory protein